MQFCERCKRNYAEVEAVIRRVFYTSTGMSLNIGPMLLCQRCFTEEWDKGCVLQILQAIFLSAQDEKFNEMERTLNMLQAKSASLLAKFS